MGLMGTIPRFDPLAELARFENLGDDLLRGFTIRPSLRAAELEPQFRVDVAEDENSYRVKADLPGAKKENIKVAIDGGRVSISVDAGAEEWKGMRFVRRERHVGALSRTFELMHDVTEQNAQAKYSDGILDLVLPKATAGHVKSIAIS